MTDITTTLVDTSDLHERTGPIDRFVGRMRDSSRALSAIDELNEVRTQQQVALGTAVILNAGATAIASTNARAVEQLSSVQIVLEGRVAGAIESVSAAEDNAIVSSGAICTAEIGHYEELVGAGRLTEQDAKYAAARANERHAFRLERAAKRADRLVESFDGAASEALRRSSGGHHEQG